MKFDPSGAGGAVGGAGDAPAVTVLMPVYNYERFVGETIESVLRQTWADFEFLVVNDGSTDRTREIVASFGDPRIRLVDNPSNIGPAKSLNRGLALARGEFVAAQDGDDLSHPTRLAEQLAFVRAHPDVALVGAQVRVIDARGRVLYRPGWERAKSEAGIRFQLMFDNAFAHSCALFRREIVRRLGGYDETCAYGTDFDLWSRVAARHPVRNLPLTLVDYRVHDATTGALLREGRLAKGRAVVASNLQRYLGLAHVPDEWPRLITGMYLGHAPGAEDDLIRLAAVAVEIFDRFVEHQPEGRADPEVRGVVAGKLCQIACRLAGSRRRDALATFRRARRFDAATARSFAAKFFPLLLLGEGARALLNPTTKQGRLTL